MFTKNGFKVTIFKRTNESSSIYNKIIRSYSKSTFIKVCYSVFVEG